MLTNGSDIPADGDLVLALGGDGTVLRAVRALMHLNLPFWSINYGHLGYLTDCEPEEAFQALESILAGTYRLEHRSLMQGVLHHEGKEQPFTCLNEAVIHRAGFARTLRMALSVSGTGILTFAGDGAILCTATGSTAYNLSAGGPILMPESGEMAVTPICPHSSSCTPMVVPKEQAVTVQVHIAGEDETGALPQLVVDGALRFPLQQGDSVTCQTTAHGVAFVRTGNESFYQRLQAKLARRE